MVAQDELMIGNYVGIEPTALHADGGSKELVFEIIEIGKYVAHFKDFAAGEYYKDLRPIPVTFEKLIEFGFDPNNDHKHPDAPMYFIDVRGKITCFIHNCSHGHILFLHEVQNAFKSLTGKHLTIAP